MASFVLKLAEQYKKEEKTEASIDIINYKHWNVALNRALSTSAWENMQKFCRIVEYVDIIFDLLNQGKKSG